MTATRPSRPGWMAPLRWSPNLTRLAAPVVAMSVVLGISTPGPIAVATAARGTIDSTAPRGTTQPASDRPLPSTGSKNDAAPAGGDKHPPKPAIKKPGEALTAQATAAGGDTLAISNLQESPVDNQYVYCGQSWLPYSGSVFATCATVYFTDATSADGSAPPNNSQRVQIYDACGALISDTSSYNWYTLGTNPMRLFSNSTLGGYPVTVPWNNGCAGTWTHITTFSLTFTDGVTLTASASMGFQVYPDAPAAAQALEQSFGGTPIHASQADPVDSQSGAFNYRPDQPDLTLASRGAPIVMARSYSSNAPRDSILGRGWTFAYDATLSIDSTSGRVTYHDPGGSQQVFTPDGSGGYTPPAGIFSTLQPSPSGFTLTFKDATQYGFSATGSLLSTRDRNGQGADLTYVLGQLTMVTGSGGRSLNLAYGSGGTLSDVTGSDGRTMHYGYDASARLTTFTDARGKVTQYGYDAAGRLASVLDPNNNYPVRLTYDGTTGRVISQKDAKGGITTFGWTDSGGGSGQATVTDPRSQTSQDFYLNGYLTRQVDPSGAETRYTWNDAGELVRVSNPAGDTTLFGYDYQGNLTMRQAPGGLSNQRESYYYNGRGDLTYTRDFNGNTTTYDYDTAGNLKTITRPDVTGGTAPIVSLTNTYNNDGTLATTTDALTHTTTFTYNTAGDLLSSTSPGGRTTTYVRDNAGRPLSSVEPRGNVTGADPNQYRTSATWDPTDRPLTSTDALGHQSVLTYDDGGRVKTQTDARGATSTISYTATNHTETIQGPDPLIAAQVITYDPDDNIATTRSPRGVTTTYTYTPTNAVQSVQSSGTGTWTYTHDAAGRLATQTAPSGRKTTFARTTTGAVSSLTYSDGTPSVWYGYDGNGNRISMSDAAGSAAYTYNALNLLTKATRGTDTFTYGYDNAGELTSRTAPTSTTQQLGYDQDGRLTTVKAGTASLVTYGYAPATGTATATLPSGVVTTTAIDAAGRPASVQSVKGSTTLAKSSYTLDPNGNPTQVTNRDGTTDTYTYDPLNRLNAVCYSTASCTGATNYIRWAYDGDSNRTTETKPAGATTYAYDTAGHLASRAGLAGTASYTYDADGNLTGAGTTKYTWNAAAQMTSAGGTKATTYAYDGDNHRLSATLGNTVTKTTVDPTTGQLALERDGTGKTLRQYTYGVGPVGYTSGGSTYNDLTDATGSVRAVTDSTGTAQWTYDYTPYGTTKTATSGGRKAPTNLLQFNAAYSDGSTYRMGAREYDPANGRFLSADPLAIPGLGYGFANANPMRYTDPSGLDGFDWIFATHSVAEGVATVAGTISVACLVLVVCAEVDLVTGPLALAASAVSVATSDSTRACISGKGGCGAAIISGALLGAGAGRFGLGRLAEAAGSAAAKAEAGVVRHYTTDAAAGSISKSGRIEPGLSSGKTWLTPDKYGSGAEAQARLALNKTPDGYFEIPMCRVRCPSGPSPVEPFYGQPGGGTQITTGFPIGVKDLPFYRFGG